MNKSITLICVALFFIQNVHSQGIIPLDTNHWDIQANSYVLEHHRGKEAIYLQNGSIRLKDTPFLNGTIEFDIFLKEAQMFPGVFFRGDSSFAQSEHWYMRPHLSGKPDANQAAATTNGVTPWQLYFGDKYSFSYEYKFDNWTHVKLVVSGNEAQVYLDHAKSPQLSWNMFHEPKSGGVLIRGGRQAMYIANVIVDQNKTEIIDFTPIKRESIEGLVSEWEISGIFQEKQLENIDSLDRLINSRIWGRKIQVEEGIAANISRQQVLYKGEKENTVFAKLSFTSTKDAVKLFHFGYSDRVVAVFNGDLIYRGNNKWRSRDYRYLGTVGLFDAIYLKVKKGENTLLMAVSEDFGGWLITGKFEDESGIK